MPSTEPKITIRDPDTLPNLAADRPGDATTAWRDLWSATSTARTETPYGDQIRRQAGESISHAISEDPAEAARIRRARASARAGRIYPRHGDTRSS